jgi:hypothetical protein
MTNDSCSKGFWPLEAKERKAGTGTHDNELSPGDDEIKKTSVSSVTSVAKNRKNRSDKGKTTKSTRTPPNYNQN